MRTWKDLESKPTVCVCVWPGRGDISHSFGVTLPLYKQYDAHSSIWTPYTRPRDWTFLGPEYLFSDAERAITGQLKLGKVHTNQGPDQLIIQGTQPTPPVGPHRNTGSSTVGRMWLIKLHTNSCNISRCAQKHTQKAQKHTELDLPLASSGGVPSTDVFDVLYCLLLHQHKAVFVCLVHSAA